MYGLPFFTAKINPDLYEKKEILSQIEKNYKVSRVRNNWSPSAYSKTDIHQSIEDEENPRFKKINYYLEHDKSKNVNFYHNILYMIKLRPKKSYVYIVSS